MKFCLKLVFTFLASSALSIGGESIFTDPFESDITVTERRAVRGDWKVNNGVASVEQDDELYKKFKDHGPIIFYDFPSTNATYHYSVKPSGCQSVVFTLNAEEGHVFRFVSGKAGTNFRAFPPDSETKSISTGRETEWLLPENEWTSVSVKIEGPLAIVTFGNQEPLMIKHPSYDRAKTNFSIGFAFGSLAIKDVRVTTD